MQRSVYDAEHETHRDGVRRFVAAEVVPHRERWERAGRVDRELFLAAGKAGVLGVAAPEEHGGGGNPDFRFNAVLNEELAAADVLGVGLGLSLQADIALPYLLDHCTPEQAARWLPDVVGGETILALAMTEPGAGSDVAAITTRAVRDGDDYVVTGTKTFITNALNADLVITAVKTDPAAGRKGISLLVVDANRAGFRRGTKLSKVGQHAADTAELFFDAVRVPATQLLGEEGRGFYLMMNHLSQERLAVAVQATAQARRAYELSLEHAKSREAFGSPIGAFQHNRFALAELKTETEIAQSYVDRLLLAHSRGELDPVEAAQAKWWISELCKRVVDRAVQLHGGAGYLSENPVARAWIDSRIQTIYAGTTEVMKEIIGRSLGV
ncbi:acyl-CoA dehydrogenase family protein [Amycolatopsis rhabdoformis]|uniref:Acyl-[acyl-carrier-protein] dehydrogenase MbtN n=1 Tax=Amycolatopsis rhabdoformis TaxID=1448059 RepID=A0ABZ1IIH4_9PSEU|nr:acyl-CoA dehydrogenase family protein [Amycolatopsis rhabdoformis]WSE34220.1 acyl-CoA dehydrogenase family protein [Amycolatopsis rhabdoformis]